MFTLINAVRHKNKPPQGTVGYGGGTSHRTYQGKPVSRSDPGNRFKKLLGYH